MNARDLVISSTVELNAPLTAEFTAGRNIVGGVTIARVIFVPQCNAMLTESTSAQAETLLMVLYNFKATVARARL